MHKNGGEDSAPKAAAKLQVMKQAPEVNTEALIIAREMAGMTQVELSKVSGLTQAKISRFEDGISLPTAEESAVMSKAMGIPAHFFYSQDIRRSVFNSFYRKRKSVAQKPLMQFNARVCFRQAQVDRLMDKVEMENEPIPRFDPEDYPGGFRQVAAALRQLFKLPPGPVKKLIQPMEDAGVVIIMENFGVPKLDGVSTFSNKRVPIIFLNIQAPPSRRRFSLAHEIAHTALHRHLTPDVDEQADSLAAEFLMPESEITNDLEYDRLSLERLADLKLKWRVSMAALLFRAKTLGIIDARKYSYLWAKMSGAGYRIREPHEEFLDDERPSLERELIRYHLENLQYSNAELAEALDVSEDALTIRYGLLANLQVM
jgi:Zn-dependent peptidase ImmA (M78 family)/transcriptional regulator with XRE-family HTH domain